MVQAGGQGAIHPFTREFFHPEDRVKDVAPVAAQRFYSDSQRFPPASYEEQSLLWKQSFWRQLEPEERAQLMGWPAHFTKTPSTSSNKSTAVQNSVIGNGFHIPTVLAVLSFIPQLLATKLPPAVECADEQALLRRLEGTVWEPNRLNSFPHLMTAWDSTEGMKTCFPDLSLPTTVWDTVEARLKFCDLPSLQTFSAWQRLRGQPWQMLGPVHLDAVERTKIFAGLSDQRYPRDFLQRHGSSFTAWIRTNQAYLMRGRTAKSFSSVTVARTRYCIRDSCHLCMAASLASLVQPFSAGDAISHQSTSPFADGTETPSMLGRPASEC